MAARVWSRHPWLTLLGALVACIVILALVWDWDWLRPLVERQASKSLGRPVTIGHFDVVLGRNPLLVADMISIANPSDFPQGTRTGTIERLAVRIDPESLFGSGPVRLPEIDIEHPQGDLGPGPSGHFNWELTAAPGSDGAVQLPEIGALTITDGDVHLLDPRHKLDVMLTIRTQDAAAGAAENKNPAPANPPAEAARILIGVKGSYQGQAVDGRFIGGSLLSLRDRSAPYPVDVQLKHGATQIVLKGSVDDPLHFAGTRLALDLRGNDMADLFPLTNIPLPPTPAYRLKGALDYAQGKIRFRNFSGTVGNSDLSGNLAVDPGKERPLVTADFLSKKIVLADLAGFIGGTPGKANSSADTHKQERVRQDANPRLLPDTPINLPKLRSADLKVTYKAARIDSPSTPLDNLAANLTVENGKLSLTPLSFGIGRGQITGNIALDGQQDLVHAVADIDFRQVDLRRIMQSTKSFEGAGLIGGKMTIDTTGNSLAMMLARGDGDLKLFMTGGDISALLVDLAGLDFGNSLLAALGLPKQAPVRCMVSDFGLEKGVLDTRLMLVDTTEANILGKGTVDLRSEKVDMQITTEPKHFSVGSLAAPIDITGPLKSPSVLPDPATFAAKGGLAAVMGVLLTPLGALIPTIQLGLGKDTDCDGVLKASAVGGQGNGGNEAVGKASSPPKAQKPRAPRRMPAERPQHQ